MFFNQYLHNKSPCGPPFEPKWPLWNSMHARFNALGISVHQFFLSNFSCATFTCFACFYWFDLSLNVDMEIAIEIKPLFVVPVHILGTLNMFRSYNLFMSKPFTNVTTSSICICFFYTVCSFNKCNGCFVTRYLRPLLRSSWLRSAETKKWFKNISKRGKLSSIFENPWNPWFSRPWWPNRSYVDRFTRS